MVGDCVGVVSEKFWGGKVRISVKGWIVSEFSCSDDLISRVEAGSFSFIWFWVVGIGDRLEAIPNTNPNNPIAPAKIGVNLGRDR